MSLSNQYLYLKKIQTVVSTSLKWRPEPLWLYLARETNLYSFAQMIPDLHQKSGMICVLHSSTPEPCSLRPALGFTALHLYREKKGEEYQKMKGKQVII
jgi:hypothetical protein